MTPDVLSSAQNSIIKQVKKLGQSKSERYKHALFLLEHVASIKTCLERHPEKISFLCIQESAIHTIDPNLISKSTTYIIKDSLFSSISTLKNSAGILAVCHIPSYSEEDINSKIISSLKRVVLCDQLSNPSNFGAIVRNAIAFHIDAILYTKDSVDPFHPDSVRAMAGNFFQKPILCCDQTLFKTLIDRSFTCYNLTPHCDTLLDDISVDEHALFIFGSEAHGINSPFLLDYQANIQSLKIPTDDQVESLNVAVSSGILFYSLSS